MLFHQKKSLYVIHKRSFRNSNLKMFDIKCPSSMFQQINCKDIERLPGFERKYLCQLTSS